MKFQPDTSEGVNIVTRHDPSGIWVGNVAFAHSLLVPWSGEVLRWPPATTDDLVAEHFTMALGLAPELVIFGSGTRLRFVSPALLRALIDAGIGVETMDTAAACRTYNVLAAEGRRVIAALLLAPPAPVAD